ncbi:MAG: WYL domain-containing protein [Anaerolineae bacterium]|nr:WYL domain-containing protein [Anaerolineae bacterium]NIN96405.1 WYL domain-containing protein [Anaerolineae bacterium]NIQ79441.1 WYL domain-containing protein [Anaerolineae bacterium]
METPALSIPLDELTFTVLDVETTGLNPHFGDRVCEIALLQCQGGIEMSRFHSLVNPRRPISPGAFAVNRIRDEDLIDAPLFSEIAEAVLEVLGDGVMVAHNAPFDLGFLASELAISRLPPVENPVVDTLALCRYCYSFPSNSLPNVAYYLGIDTQREHRALADAITTKHLLDHLLADLSGAGVYTLGDLMGVQGGQIGWPAQEIVPLPPQIDEALRGEGQLELRYVSASGEETRRLVRPLYVTAFAGYLYLIAFCHLRDEQRTFRLDRIIGMRSGL